MAGLGRVLTGLSKLLSRNTTIPAITVKNDFAKAVADSTPAEPKNPPRTGMDPNKWVGHKMLRDVRRRKCAKEHATMRVRLISMKRNDILPPEIRELASKDMDEIPRQSALRQLVPRCALTSRPRGTVHRWRLSRIVFRDLADYNKLSGMQRAMW